MDEKVCIVTGANRGIGRAIAEGIVRKGHQVILVCRNETTGNFALNKLRSTFPKTDLVIGDLSSIKSVNTLTQELLNRFPRIDVLIHNAGIWPSQLTKNKDGLEMAFMVNHLAPFYMTHLLLDRLKSSNSARIVLVNAGLYVRGSVDLKRTPWGDDFHRMKTYMNTKLCGILFMRKLAPMLEGTGVTINAVHPGVIRTGLGDFGGVIGVILRGFKLFMGSPKKGAKGPIHLALSSSVRSNGGYYDKIKEKALVSIALDDTLANELWDLSQELCGI